jgi:hypothetical protein
LDRDFWDRWATGGREEVRLAERLQIRKASQASIYLWGFCFFWKTFTLYPPLRTPGGVVGPLFGGPFSGEDTFSTRICPKDRSNYAFYEFEIRRKNTSLSTEFSSRGNMPSIQQGSKSSVMSSISRLYLLMMESFIYI